MPQIGIDQAILDALPAHIALLDPNGRIEVVNAAWREFGAARALHTKDFGVGSDYLALCDSARGDGSNDAREMSSGIRAILRGEQSCFELEYPCHSPAKMFWFRAIVTPINLQERRCALVIHIDITKRVLAERTLKQAEHDQRFLIGELGRERERLITAEAVAKLGSWEMDISSSEIFWSDEMYRIFEVDRDRFTHTLDAALAFTHPDDRAAVEAAFNELLSTRVVTSLDHRLLLSDGRIRHVNSRWQIFADDSGVPIKAIGTCQDITERDAANEKLLQSDRELRQSRLHLAIAQRVASIGSAAIDFRTGKWDWSDENFRIYGLEPGAIIPSAETLAALVHPDDRAGLLSNIPLAKSGITPPPLEYRIIRPDGEERLLRREATLIRDDTGNVIGIVGAVQDVTELRAAQKAKEKADNLLKEQATMLSNAQRIGRMGSWSFNLRDGRLSWSDATHELFGITPAEFKGTFEHFQSFIVPEDLPSCREAHARVSPQTPLLEAQYRIRRPDGEVRWMHDRSNVTFDEKGNMLARIGMVSDITELRKFETQLRDGMRLEAVGQLTGGLAHDFNNLLTVVLGNAEALTTALKDDPQLCTLAEMTMQAAEKGAELTRRLLAFARRQPLAPKITDINELLLGMKTLLQPAIEGHIDLEWECDERLWHALIDASQLENVLLNLCINARDAMPDGGRIKIRTNNIHLEEGYFGIYTEFMPGPYVQITISDTGIGMDRQTLARAFEPFFTTKETGKGSGLGLSMVYGFIKQSQGHIKIDSELGRGTTVNLYLPMAVGSSSTEGVEKAIRDLPGGKENILMVEDDDLVRAHVSRQLHALGYQVTETRNGLEALSVLKTSDNDFDLLFTDLMLPSGLDGHRLAEETRKLKPEIAVLFTSGYSKELLKRRESGRRSDPVLSKPYRMETLALMIRRTLGA